MGRKYTRYSSITPVSDMELNRRVIIKTHSKSSLHFDDATICVRRGKLNGTICNDRRTNKFLLISDENPKLVDSSFQVEILWVIKMHNWRTWNLVAHLTRTMRALDLEHYLALFERKSAVEVASKPKLEKQGLVL